MGRTHSEMCVQEGELVESAKKRTLLLLVKLVCINHGNPVVPLFVSGTHSADRRGATALAFCFMSGLGIKRGAI